MARDQVQPRRSSDGTHHNPVSGNQANAQGARQRAAAKHEKYAHEPHGRAPSKSEIRKEVEARAAPLRVSTVFATAIVAALFVASCIYWIVVILMPPAGK